MYLKILFYVVISLLLQQSCSGHDEDDMMDFFSDHFESSDKREEEFFENLKNTHHFATKTPYRYVNPTHHDLFHFKSSEFFFREFHVTKINLPWHLGSPHVPQDFQPMDHSLRPADLGYDTTGLKQNLTVLLFEFNSLYFLFLILTFLTIFL